MSFHDDDDVVGTYADAEECEVMLGAACGDDVVDDDGVEADDGDDDDDAGDGDAGWSACRGV